MMRSVSTLRLLQRSSLLSNVRCRDSRSHRHAYCSACSSEATFDGNGAIPAKSVRPDHRELAVGQELFITSKYSPGSPLFLPNGTRIFNKLRGFLQAQYERFGFQEVITPNVYKKSLWEKSGHWENYAEDMYAVTGRGATGTREGQQIGEDEEYGLKPMNCPGHCLIFASKIRSYRDLPIRYADFSSLHRNEVHGALSGLTRVRRFHQDDGHIFCRPSQIGEEISKTLDFVDLTYRILRLGSYRLALSTRPKDQFIGTVKEWDNAESALKASLNESGMQWSLSEGDGAFYGPKIDIILKDSDGKEHQTATIQLDFQLPKRFELQYQAPAPELEQQGLSTGDMSLLAVQGPVTPVLIHRAVLGSVERIMALLIEHYNGHWPFWLNPRQVVIISVSDKPDVLEFADACRNLLRGISGAGIGNDDAVTRDSNRIAVDVDYRPIPLGKKLSEAKRLRYSIIAVVGAKDIQLNQIQVDFSGIPSNQLRQIGALSKMTEKELKTVPLQVEILKDVLEQIERAYG